MSGAEPIALVGLVDACIGITKTIIAIGRAVHDAHGLPPKLRDVFDRLPAIETILITAQEACNKCQVDEGKRNSARPLLEQCRTALAELQEIISKACPENGDSRATRVWKGTKTAFFGRSSKVQELLKTVQDNLKFLEQQEIYTISNKLDGLAPYETQPEPSSNIPFPRDRDYVARTEITAHIDSALSYPAARLALVGLGGVGKSQIAIEYCYRMRETFPDTWVFWIHASTHGRYEQSVRDIADLARIPGRSESTADIYNLFRDWLREKASRKWLIVLDNADEVDFLVERFNGSVSLFERLPVCDQGNILITSRSMSSAERLVDMKARIPIPRMDRQQAAMLLQHKLGSQVAGVANTEDCEALAVALDFMPLAISQAAAYIQQRGTLSSVKQYLAKLDKKDQSKRSILDENFKDHRRDPEAHSAIMATWQISFEHLRRERQSATDLLSLMCFCDRQAIPSVLLQTLESDEESNTTRLESNDNAGTSSAGDSTTCPDIEEEFFKDIAMLKGFAFISNSSDSCTFEMHRLVQLATQRWLYNQGQAEHWKKVFIRNLDILFPSGDYETWETCRKLFPHAIAVSHLEITDREALLLKASICERGGRYANTRSLLGEAEEMCSTSYKIRAEIFGSENLDTLESMSKLAATYCSQGRTNEAEQLVLQVLKAKEKLFGPEHLETLPSLSQLANVYKHQRRLSEAEQLDIKVLQHIEALLGPEHPDTYDTMELLVTTYVEQERWSEAEQLHVKLLEARKAMLGPEHPDTLRIIGYLADAYIGEMRHDEAEQLLIKLVETSKSVLGPEHPDTLTSIRKLAVTYVEQGRWVEATDLLTQAVDKAQKALGPQHPDTELAILQLERVGLMQQLDALQKGLAISVDQRKDSETPGA